MGIDDKTVREFQELYGRVYRKTLTLDEAREIVRRMLMLFELLIQKIANTPVTAIPPRIGNRKPGPDAVRTAKNRFS